MTSLTADHLGHRVAAPAGPPVGHALGAFFTTTVGLLVLVGADVAGTVQLAEAAASQLGVVASTTFTVAAIAAAYRAWAVLNPWAAVLALALLGPGAAWSWMTFVDGDPPIDAINSAVIVVSCGLATVLLTRGIRHRQWLPVFGGLGAMVVGMVGALVRIDPATASTGSAALLAAVAGMICLYGLLADLEASEHRSLAQLIETRREIEAEVERVEDLLHDLRSGLLAIETAVGAVDDDLAVPLRAEAARLRRLTLTGQRTVDRFDLTTSLVNLVAARRATGTSVVFDTPLDGRVDAWGEETEILSILENLLSNAERHGRYGPIAVAVGSNDEHVKVAVTNAGGLPPGDPEAIFLRGVTTHPSGRGLGLARGRMLARLNGAELTLGPSGPDHTTFVLTLRTRPPAPGTTLDREDGPSGAAAPLAPPPPLVSTRGLRGARRAAS